MFNRIEYKKSALSTLKNNWAVPCLLTITFLALSALSSTGAGILGVCVSGILTIGIIFTFMKMIVVQHSVATSEEAGEKISFNTFLEGIERSVKEGFCRVASNLISSSTNTLDEVETVKCDTDIKGSEPTVLNCDVPSMYQLIILLLEGMKGCCHDRLWNDESIPHKKEACPTALKVCEKIAKEAGLMGECESETSDEANAALKGKTPRKKKGKAKAKKEKPVLTKEFVNKKVIKLDEKKTKKAK
jgi:hypothetical protein